MANKPAKKRVRLYGVQRTVRDRSNCDRPRSDARYHTWRWTKESKAFRDAHPLCENCLKKGLYVPSEVVDHIIPIAIHDFWDESNWQALCAKCNVAKGNRDKKIINSRKYER